MATCLITTLTEGSRDMGLMTMTLKELLCSSVSRPLSIQSICYSGIKTLGERTTAGVDIQKSSRIAPFSLRCVSRLVVRSETHREGNFMYGWAFFIPHLDLNLIRMKEQIDTVLDLKSAVSTPVGHVNVSEVFC